MNNVVVKDVFNVQPVLVQRMTNHLIPRRIHNNIEVIALVVVHDDGVALQHTGKRQYLGLAFLEDLFIVPFVILDEFHPFAGLVLEPYYVISLLFYEVADSIADIKSVANDLEIGRHTGGVDIEDGVALYLEDHIFRLFVSPNTLQQLFGLLALWQLLWVDIALPTACHDCQQDINPCDIS